MKCILKEVYYFVLNRREVFVDELNFLELEFLDFRLVIMKDFNKLEFVSKKLVFIKVLYVFIFS